MLTFIEDDYVRDRVRWVVELSNGATVYEDDGRPGVEPASAWVRLKAYCKAQGLHITKMRVQFRSNSVWLPEGADGYYFAKGVVGIWGDKEVSHFLVAGPVIDGEAHVIKYGCPGLEVLGSEVRELDDDDDQSVIARWLT